MKKKTAKKATKKKAVKSSAKKKKNPNSVVPKKKFPVFSVIFLVILLFILGMFGYFLLQDDAPLGQCEEAIDCGIYFVNTLKDKGYVCLNDHLISSGGLKTKTLLFKYASKRSVEQTPSNCLCQDNFCEVTE